ncbi:hypothetical protein ACE1BF_002437 [Salmonella enterica]|nr:hypothetical protein [Salmonella enterica]
MKLTIEDVQLAIKGLTKYSNQCISDQLLAVVAGNYAKANNIIILRLQSLYEDEFTDFTAGEIKNLYYTEKTGQAQLRGDLIFDTEKLDIQSILHSLAHGCVYLSPYFMNVMSLDYGFACLSQVTLSKAEYTDFDGIEPLDISCLDGLINALYKEEPATEAPAEPQGDKPYIYAPGMTSNEINRWLDGVILNLRHLNTNKERLQEADEARTELENAAKRSEAFLAEVIRN